MSDDLIKRLKYEDADRIKELQRERAKAMETLRPFADVLKGNYSHQPDTMPSAGSTGGWRMSKTLKELKADVKKAEANYEAARDAPETVWDAWITAWSALVNARMALAELEGGK
jgi:hypothetical protein